jgi:sugar/nucleoside kinase (ribokinase family)
MADAEDASSETAALLPHLTSLIAPREVILALGRSSDVVTAARTLFADGPAVVVATMGAQGAEGVTASGEHQRVPAVPCEVVDTTGAGDAFHAGYVAAALRGSRFAACIEFAARVAAAKCETSGPTVAVARLAALARELPPAGAGAWI